MKQVIVLMLLFMGTIVSGTLVNAQAIQQDDILGFWLNEEKDAKVEITKIDGKFYGKVVWLKEPNEEWGTPKVDDQNPDESLRNTPIMGLEILKDFVFDEDEWNSGTIYDPDNGKTYKCVMKKQSDIVLDIRGYIGKQWMGLGRTTVWTRP